MKHLKKSILSVIVAATLLLTMTMILASCSSPTAIVTPVDDEEEYVTRVAVPQGVMSIHDVLILSNDGLNIKWSMVEEYEHTDVDEQHAVFKVQDELAGEYTLEVEHDGDTINSAILSRSGYSIDIRTESVTDFWRKVMKTEKEQ
ncbi:MAG: hypothetical protein IJU16_07035 [Clostridia bacterium]|nr:hypothetical protein [Clostridia bacterium]